MQEEYKIDAKSSKSGSGSKKRVKGNLCRDANGKFVPCGIVTEEKKSKPTRKKSDGTNKLESFKVKGRDAQS